MGVEQEHRFVLPETSDRFVLSMTVFAVLLAQVLLYPGIDSLVSELGASTQIDASKWFLAAEFFAFVAFASVWGAVSDSTGVRSRLISVGALGGGIGYFALILLGGSVGFGGVLVLRFVQGAMTIGAFSLAITMLMDLKGGSGRNMGAAGIAIGLGTAIGAPLGGQLYEVSTFLPLYVAGGLLFVVSVFVWFGVTDRTPTESEGVAEVLRGLSRKPVLSLPYCFGFIDRFTAGFFALVGTFYFREFHGLGEGATGLTLALFFAPFALLQYPFGVLSDRIGRTVPIVLGSSLYGVAVIAVGVPESLIFAQAMMFVVGVLGAFMAPATMALVNDISGESERGAAMGGFNIFGSLGFLAGILVGGTVAEIHGYFEAFLVAGGAEVALALITVPVFLRLSLSADEFFDSS